jgi:hypothetical protein
MSLKVVELYTLYQIPMTIEITFNLKEEKAAELWKRIWPW